MCSSNASERTLPVETSAVMLLLFVTFVVSISLAATFISKNITNPVSLVTAGIEENKKKLLAGTKKKTNLDDLFDQMKAGELKELEIIIKADKDVEELLETRSDLF